jgi:hypothetical protein
VAGDENFLVMMNQIFTKQQHESYNYSKKKLSNYQNKVLIVLPFCRIFTHCASLKDVLQKQTSPNFSLNHFLLWLAMKTFWL